MLTEIFIHFCKIKKVVLKVATQNMLQFELRKMDGQNKFLTRNKKKFLTSLKTILEHSLPRTVSASRLVPF